MTDITDRVQVLDRIALILQCFEATAESGTSDLARTTGLSKGTTHRLLSALVHHRFLEQDETSRKYRLGLRLFELGSRAVAQLDAVRAAQPYLRQLADRTGETAHLGILAEYSVLYISKVECEHALRMPSSIGHRVPLHCTGLGKVLLAHLSPSELAALLENRELVALTPKTITTPDVLRSQLLSIRQNGFAVDNEELEIGVRCVAAPIWDYSGGVNAAVSVSGPTARLTASKTSALVESVVAAASEISQRMGGRLG